MSGFSVTVGFSVTAYLRKGVGIKIIHCYNRSWMEGGAVRENCLAQEHSTMTPARAQKTDPDR